MIPKIAPLLNITNNTTSLGINPVKGGSPASDNNIITKEILIIGLKFIMLFKFFRFFVNVEFNNIKIGVIRNT